MPNNMDIQDNPEGGLPFWDSGVDKEEAISPSSDAASSNPRMINAKFSTHPWDIVWIGTPMQPLPGICKIMDGATEISIDMKKPEGKDGSTITVKGYRPGPFEIQVIIWSREQWLQLQSVLNVIWRKPLKEPTKKDKRGNKIVVSDIAVGVFHPALSLYGIHSCAVQGVTFPTEGPWEGARTVKIKCLENVPPGPKKQTKTASSKTSLAPSFSAAQSIVDANGNEVVQSSINAVPVPPSKNKKSLGPKGPVSTPANGST